MYAHRSHTRRSDSDCAFVPFGLASGISNTSDACDALRDAINTKRGDNLGKLHEHGSHLLEMEKYLEKLNRGQGLGVTVFGVVIDAAMMNKIFTSVVSFMVTVVPIILTLYAPPTKAVDTDTSATCTLTHPEQASIQGTFGLINASCTYNITVGPAGVIMW